MKKGVLYILLSLFAIAVILLLVMIGKSSPRLDERITLRRTDKIPYGTFVAYNSLPMFFDHVLVAPIKKQPSDWYNPDSVLKGGTLFMAITPRFDPDESELRYLQSFVENGNDVFISTFYFGEQAEKFFGFTFNGSYLPTDSASGKLEVPPFDTAKVYKPLGYSSNNAISNYNTTYTEILQRNALNEVNFVRIKSGNGYFYIHANPFLFTNYFLISENNRNYLQKVYGLLKQKEKPVTNILYDEYFATRIKSNNKEEKDRSVFRGLLGVEAFRWAFWSAILLTLLYVVIYAKRSQRVIPILEKPKNDSLEFAKIIGRLYFEKRDHHNLALKMCTYFLDFVRNRYLIKTTILDEDFIKKLSAKSGYPEIKVTELVDSIRQIQQTSSLNETDLGILYHQFQNFYKTVS